MQKTKNILKYGIILTILIILALIPMLTNNNTHLISYADSSNLTITLDGYAEKEVSPDYATINANIVSVDLDSKIAKNKAMEMFNEIKNQLNKSQIDNENIIIDSFSSSQNYQVSCRQSSLGNYVYLRFSIKTNLDNITKILTILEDNGVNEITSIEYSVSNDKTIYNDLIKDAILNAEQKAKDTLGTDNLQITEIEEKDNYYCATLYKYGTDIFDDTTNLGKIQITAKVQVKFSVQSM